MADEILLDGSDTPAQLTETGYTLFAPGLVGLVKDVTSEDPKPGETLRSDGVVSEPIVQRLGEAEMITDRVFEINIEFDQVGTGDSSERTRSGGVPIRTRLDERAILLDVPILQERDMAILYTDEDGAQRWIFPDEKFSTSEKLVFGVPRDGILPQERETLDEATRGRKKFGKRILRIISWFPKQIIGSAAKYVASAFERKKYAIMPVPLQDNGKRPPVNWDHLSAGPALLLCHGTMSSTEKSFQHFLNTNEFSEIIASFEKRVFAFDHPTLSKTPVENVDWFLDNVPKDKPLNLNILTTSRGGLVAREFLHRVSDLNQNGWDIKVDRLVMSACPNRGTALAKPESIPDYLDRITNLLQLLPIPFTDLIDKILGLVKLLAKGIIGGLPGLQAQNPESDFIRTMNGRHAPVGTALYALAANFEPTKPGWLKVWRKVANNVVDAIFKEENDAIVPTNGVSEIKAQAAGFPIHNHFRSKDTNIHHLSYFDNTKIREQARDWLLDPPLLNQHA